MAIKEIKIASASLMILFLLIGAWYLFDRKTEAVNNDETVVKVHTKLEDIPYKLNNKRLAEAADEWYYSPMSPIDPANYRANAKLEFPEEGEIQNINDILIQLNLMYSGEQPFNHYRAAALDYFANYGPMLSETAIYGPVPIPYVSNSGNQDVRIGDVVNSYKEFYQYYEKVKRQGVVKEDK